MLIQALMRLSLTQMEAQLEEHQRILDDATAKAATATAQRAQTQVTRRLAHTPRTPLAHTPRSRTNRWMHGTAQAAAAAAAAEAQSEASSGDALLNAGDQMTVVEILSRAGAITSAQVSACRHHGVDLLARRVVDVVAVF